MRVSPWLSGWLALAACAGDEGSPSGDDTGEPDVEVVAYELHITLLTPLDEPGVFDDVATVILRVEPAIGDPWEVELTDISDGGYDQAEGLPAIEDASIAIIGKDGGGEVVAFGRSAPVTVTEGEVEIAVLVSEVDETGLLASLTQELAGGALVADGTGRFLLFGGSTDGLYGSASGTDAVLALDIGAPDVALAFTEVGTLPPVTESGPTGRVGHTATLLTGSHPDNGRILVVGGSSDYQGCQHATNQVLLWDPLDDSYEDLGVAGSLDDPRFHHTATEDPAGNVVIAGGSTDCGDKGSGIVISRQVLVYRPAERAAEDADGSASIPLIWHAAARLGSDGVLLCGGVDFADTTYTISDDCDLVRPTGELERKATTLPIPLAHHRMTTLADGSVLVTGGFSVNTETDEDARVEASENAFVFDGTSWQNAGPMVLARGMHAAAALPDGRAVVAGGLSETRTMFWNGEDPLACVEIYDPSNLAQPFALVDDCDATSLAASLPEPASEPMIAADDDYGVVIAGGMTGQNSRTVGGVTLFVGAP